jgi:hypothetical protein
MDAFDMIIFVSKFPNSIWVILRLVSGSESLETRHALVEMLCIPTLYHLLGPYDIVLLT